MREARIIPEPGEVTNPAGHRLEELQAEIGYYFLNRRLLEMAMCHESYTNEQVEVTADNERLEFLGDAVLGVVISRYLYEAHPELPEGKLAQMKAFLVSTNHLATKARRIGLGQYLRLGRGEQLCHGRRRSSLLTDAFEALLGAVFLDRGLEAATEVILGYFGQDIDECLGVGKDHKSRLQEVTQQLFKTLPDYRVLSEEGPPHLKNFTVQVFFQGQLLGEGSGPSKRQASQVAAAEALAQIEDFGLRGDLPGPETTA